jgi:DNA-directed RNA polymerase subunit M/transcription elongation factor TFIIS
MRCMGCDSEMVLMKVLPGSTGPAAGFERRSFKCSACQSVERHLVFISAGREADAEPLPVHVASNSAERRGQSFKKPVGHRPRVDTATSAVPASAVQDDRTINTFLFRRLLSQVRRQRSTQAEGMAVEKASSEPQGRTCHVCRSSMVLMSTLPATGKFPMQRFYKCSTCKFVVANC